MLWAGSIAPSNWLICDGSNLLVQNYVDLFNIIQYNYGGSDDNFNIPNLNNNNNLIYIIKVLPSNI